MDGTLVKSTVFSLGMHALLLIPLGVVGGRVSDVGFDVAQGLSSVELELVASPDDSQEPKVSASRESAAPDGQEGWAQQEADQGPSSRQEPWANDGGAIWRGKPVALRNSPPSYPREARIRGWQGTVLVRALVTPEGQAGSVKVAQSSGYPLLDRAALAALRQWQFVPARRGSQRVASLVEIPISFQLDQQEQKEKRSSP